jgi:predicted Fe-S protein YdhL (DUF1289 family)
MNPAVQDVPSPCIDVCQLDATTGLCRGCLRTMQEIAGWTAYSAVQKRAVLARLGERRGTIVRSA